MDDIRPPRPSGSPHYGRPAQQPVATQEAAAEQQAYQQHHYNGQAYESNDSAYALTKPKKAHKKRRIFIRALVILLLIAFAVGLGYLYMQNKELEQKNAELQQDVNRMSQTIFSLNYDNADLKRQLELNQAKYNDLLQTANDLKSSCGTACESVTLP